MNAQHSPIRPFDGSTFGANITEALLNPLDPGADETVLRRQVARILYDVRVTGGKTIRWMVSDIWPQWRCGADPEDQVTGSIDPAWFAVVRTLLEEAQKQHIKVVLVFMYLNEGHFSTFKGDAEQDRSLVAKWREYRRQTAGADGYRGAKAHECSDAPGYYGRVAERDLFTDPALRDAFEKRFAAMADFAVRFPALGAIELFNEPQTELTATPDFWSLVKQCRDAIRRSGPAGAAVPIISGVSAWDASNLRQAKAAGELDREAFIAVHAYEDFSGGDGAALTRLKGLVGWLRQSIPGKDIAVAEIGSKNSVSTAAVHQRMVDAVLGLHRDAKVGVWVWGGWFPQPEERDYKWDFNHRSPTGEAFRPYFFVSREGEYKTPQRRNATDERSHTTSAVTVAITQLGPDEPDPYQRSKWALMLNGVRFVGFSRAGVFRRSEPEADAAAPPLPVPMYFLGEDRGTPRWAEIVASKGVWALRVYDCVGGTGSSPETGSIDTPDILIGLASDEKRDDVRACLMSRLIYTVEL